MTQHHFNIATIYSTAQCLLSVLGSVGVILLFAGIPQLIYSTTISVINLLTFVIGAVLITTMVAGNAILNYKYRLYIRHLSAQQRSVTRTGEDKPPTYEQVLGLEAPPPDYQSVTQLCAKPPRYEEISENVYNLKTVSERVDAIDFGNASSDSPASVRSHSDSVLLSTDSNQVEIVSNNINKRSHDNDSETSSV